MERQWNILKKAFESDRLSHAYIVSGPGEVDKETFAKKFAQYINCVKPVGSKECQNCQNCKMIERNSFPDVMLIDSSKSESSLKEGTDKMEIEVAQIRLAQNFLSYKPYYGAVKVVIVDQAERMTKEAQHSFLKTLEEPRGKTLIFLTSSKPNLLLPTIASRCQEIKFFYTGSFVLLPEEQKILQNFTAVMNANLAEKFQYAKNMNLEQNNFTLFLSALRKYFRQALLINILSGDAKEDSNKKVKKLLEFIETLSYQVTTSNINQKMALEVLLIELN